MEDEYYSIDEQRAWTAVFQRLHHLARAQAGSQSEGKKPMNITRNRYRDVIPIDAHRVKLDDDQNDYINASFVEVEDVKRKYILCQGPLQHTCHHYWQMIWEQKTTGIIMLNKCIERGSNKCFQYWPTLLNQPVMMVDSFKIELVSLEEMHSYRLSTLRLENMESDEEPRTITHFHYTRWPDFGVPRTPDDFLEYLYSVQRSGVLNEDTGPAVVHCSAGIGRSGTFCLIDVCLKKIELTSDLSIDLQSILLEMRKQRLGLVQTADQLRFCYIAILQASIPESDREEEEEEEVQESDSEEEGVGLEGVKKVPNGLDSEATVGASIYNDHHFDDLPPPIPPRYPDMIPSHTPSPPPPPTLPPPGPPEYDNEGEESDSEPEELATNPRETEEDIFVRYERNESLEESQESLPWYANGKACPPDQGGQEEPPAPPPRVESVYREKESPSHGDHFLEIGRGEENEGPPLPPPTQQAPPQRPVGENPQLTDFNEEEALINELNELEKLVSQTRETPQRNGEDEAEALRLKEQRKAERDERQRRLNEKVAAMKVKISREGTREWSTSWLVVGVVAIASYCAYYYLS